MKKVIILLLAVTILLTACGRGETNVAAPPENTQTAPELEPAAPPQAFPEPAAPPAEPEPTPKQPSSEELAVIEKYSSFDGFTQDGTFFSEKELRTLFELDEYSAWEVLEAGFSYPKEDEARYESPYIKALSDASFALIDSGALSEQDESELAMLIAETMADYLRAELLSKSWYEYNEAEELIEEHALFDCGYDFEAKGAKEQTAPAKFFGLRLPEEDANACEYFIKTMLAAFEEKDDGAAAVFHDSLGLYMIEQGLIGLMMAAQYDEENHHGYYFGEIFVRAQYERAKKSAEATYWQDVINALLSSTTGGVSNYARFLYLRQSPLLWELYESTDNLGNSENIEQYFNAMIDIGAMENDELMRSAAEHMRSITGKSASVPMSYSTSVKKQLDAVLAEPPGPYALEPLPNGYIVITSPVKDPATGKNVAKGGAARDKPVGEANLHLAFYPDDKMVEVFDPRMAAYSVHIRLEYKKLPNKFISNGVMKTQYSSTTYIKITDLKSGISSEEIDGGVKHPFYVGESVSRDMLNRAKRFYASNSRFSLTDHRELASFVAGSY